MLEKYFSCQQMKSLIAHNGVRSAFILRISGSDRFHYLFRLILLLMETKLCVASPTPHSFVLNYTEHNDLTVKLEHYYLKCDLCSRIIKLTLDLILALVNLPGSNKQEVNDMQRITRTSINLKTKSVMPRWLVLCCLNGKLELFPKREQIVIPI